MVLAVCIAQIVAALLSLGYRWAATSTPVTLREATVRFSSASGPAVGAALDSQQRAAATAGSGGRAGAPESGAPAGVLPQARAIGAPGQAAQKPTAPPPPGIYSWETKGTEQGMLLERVLPESSYSHLRATEAGWTMDHIYSGEHREWLDMTSAPDGMFLNGLRTKVAFGPLDPSPSLDFDAPVRLTMSPAEAGQRWTGEWHGRTSGSYEGRTVEQSKLTLGAEEIDAWQVEVVLKLTGEAEGTIRMNLWVAPGTGMIVRGAHERDVRASSGSYSARWTDQLLSMRPEVPAA